MLELLQKILREEGVRGMFKGNGTNLLRIVPYSAVQFASYELYSKVRAVHCKSAERATRQRWSHALAVWQLFRQDRLFGNQDWLRTLIAGALAGMTSTAVTYPLDLIRTRLAVQKDNNRATRRYRGIIHTGLTVMREEGGVRALYRGMSTSFVGIAPYIGIQFMVYESLKKYIRKIHAQRGGANRTQKPPVVLRIFCGASAAIIAQTVTYPIELTRRRLQMSAIMKDGNFNYRGIAHAFQTIVRSEGIQGLYRGVLPNAIKVAPTMGIAFVTYDTVAEYLK